MTRALLPAALMVGAGLLLGPSAARAHHGDADRYETTVTSLTGTVVELQMVNPHSIITFDVTDPSGQTVRWQAEMGGTQQLTKQFGWTRNTVKVGDRITVTGRRAKSGAPYMNLTERSSIVLTDSGKEIFSTGVKNRPDLQ